MVRGSCGRKGSGHGGCGDQERHGLDRQVGTGGEARGCRPSSDVGGRDGQDGVPAGMTLAIRRERTPEGFVVFLIGDLDSGMADVVTQAITSTPELSVVVDLSDLCSLDGTGLQALVQASDHLADDGKAFSLVGARGDVMTAIRSSDLKGFG